MIYLDNSATTRPSEGVIADMVKALSEGFYNPSSAYAQALETEKRLDLCREKIKAAINAPGASVVFTSGGTESNDLALGGTISVSRAPVRIAVSAGEHPSVYEAAKALCEGRGECVILPLRPDGRVDTDSAESELKKGLTLISVMQVNNETGAINDLARVCALRDALCPDCRVHSDGVQGFLREKFDFSGVDLYSLSGHKLHAPKGVGALVIRKGLRIGARHIGGGQEKGLRSGTENTPGIIALGRAIDDMRSDTGMRERIMALKLHLYSLLKAYIPDAAVNGPEPEKGACHILNMSFPGVRGETMLHALEEKGVLVSTGSACSSKKTKVSRVLSEMGVPFKLAECAIRFSLCPFTTDEEINAAALSVKECYEALVRYQRR